MRRRRPTPGVTAAATTAVFATGAPRPGVTAAATTAVFATGAPMTHLALRVGTSVAVVFGGSHPPRARRTGSQPGGLEHGGWHTHELVILPLAADAAAGQRVPGPDGSTRPGAWAKPPPQAAPRALATESMPERFGLDHRELLPRATTSWCATCRRALLWRSPCLLACE